VGMRPGVLDIVYWDHALVGGRASRFGRCRQLVDWP
jgi:hypothetical protein